MTKTQPQPPRTHPAVICAWCNAPMSNVTVSTSGQVSHGICESCKEKLVAEIKP